MGSIADENDSATGTALEGEISDKSDKSDKDQSDQDEIEEIHFDQPIITSNGLNKLLHVSSNSYLVSHQLDQWLKTDLPITSIWQILFVPEYNQGLKTGIRAFILTTASKIKF